MARDLAILAGAGALPPQLAAAHPEATTVVFAGTEHELSAPSLCYGFEKLGDLFTELKARGIRRLVMAGAMSRPALDPAAFDPLMARLAPRLLAAMARGDDGLLREVIAILEEQGFEVLGAHELLDGLTADAGLLAGTAPGTEVEADIARAAAILTALAPLDVGQGAVVAGGQCLGIETVQGTDFLLASVARTPAQLRRAPGVLVKAAKRGQDLRVDMPAIGPGTAAALARAGLGGAVVEAGRVMILEREATLAAFRDAGLFLAARAL